MILLLLYGPYILLSIATMFCGRLFALAGISETNARRPLINIFYWLKITRIRPIFAILFFLPYVNLVFITYVAMAIMHSYQPKNSALIVWGSVLWFVGLPTLNSGATAYIKTDASQTSWNLLAIDVVLFILLKRSIINTFIFSVYAIPTSSMEKTFMTGDLVLAERLTYGPRMPVTPLSLPFFHNHLPNSDKPSYLTSILLPYYRFPSTSSVQRNDVLVFNYPVQTQFPVDKREYYMKRCVAIPGDTLQVIDAAVWVNGVKAWEPPLGQKTYLVKTDGSEITMKTFQKWGITDGGKYTEVPGVYLVGLTGPMIDSLKSLPYVKSIEISLKPKGMIDMQSHYFPYDTAHYRWNSDQYGPLVIPKKNVTVEINNLTLPLYQTIITKYEGHSLEMQDSSTILIDGKKAVSYTFKMNYYFMMGDNRDNSEDSRFWGLVPEDHIDSKVWKPFKPPFGGHHQDFRH